MRKALHVDSRGSARMVDVGAKPVTRRTAKARGLVQMSAAAFEALRTGRLAKGDALAVARIAGIQAAKRTPEIVPLCHPLSLDAVTIEVDLDPRSRAAVVSSTVSTRGRTGVEMEALAGVAGACLAIYDMIKALDRGATIVSLQLTSKTGGASGRYSR